MTRDKYICPICGYDELNEDPFYNGMLCSYEICNCCGYEYGAVYKNTLDEEYGIYSQEDAIECYRKAWILTGAKWFYEKIYERDVIRKKESDQEEIQDLLDKIKRDKPEDWSIEKQLENIDFDINKFWRDNKQIKHGYYWTHIKYEEPNSEYVNLIKYTGGCYYQSLKRGNWMELKGTLNVWEYLGENMDEDMILNRDIIERIGRSIGDIKIKDDFREREFITFKGNEKRFKIAAYLFCSAICHQTYSLKNEKLNLVGWDYLCSVFMGLAMEGSQILEIDTLYNMKEKDLIHEFERLFPEGEEGTRCTLDMLPERAEIIKDISQIIMEDYEGSLERFLRTLEDGVRAGGEKAYDILDKFKAFKDPLKKKSTLLMKLLFQSGLLQVEELRGIRPLMDYHMQRLLLRTGALEIIDAELREKLKNREELESDSRIREKCVEAIEDISQVSGISILDLDDIFWALGRSCCNDKVLCRDERCSKTPCTLTTIIDMDTHKECLLKDSCMGHGDDRYQEYWEPKVKTDYY